MLFKKITFNKYIAINKMSEIIMFPTQAKCFKNASTNNHLFYFAQDINERGAKIFGSTPDFNSFYEIYKDQDTKNFYETLHFKEPRYEYYDIDMCVSDDILPNPEKVFLDFCGVHSKFLQFSKQDNGYNDWRITDSSKDRKISLHVINKGRVWRNHKETEEWYNSFKIFVDSHYPDSMGGIIDYSVKSRNREMRMIGSSKFSQDRPLERATWHGESRDAHISDFFIQNIDIRGLKQANARVEAYKNETIERQKESKNNEKARLEYETTSSSFILVDAEDDEVEALCSMICDLVSKNQSVLCDKEFPEKMCYTDFRNWTFAYLNGDRAKNADLKKYWEEDMYPLYRHSADHDPNVLWNNMSESRVVEKSYTIKSLHYWAKSHPDYNLMFHKDLGQYEIGVFDPNDKTYYWGDFVREITDQTFEDTEKLKVFFLKNFPTVVNTEMNGDYTYYLKKESDLFSPDIPKYQVKSYIRDEKGIKTVVKTSITSLFSMFSSSLPRYNRLEFKPYDTVRNNEEENSKVLNTFVGFKAQYLEKNVDMDRLKPILDHILIVWARGEVDRFKYIISWIASIIKYPNKMNKVMLVLYSEFQQIGKGIIAEWLVNNVLGREVAGKTEDMEKVVGRFNGFIDRKILTVLDDTSSHDNYKNGCWNKLKSLITDPTQTIEKKGLETKTITSYNNFMMLTNQANAVKIDSGDARMAVFRCSNEKAGDRVYFNALNACLEESDMADMFYSYLYDLPASDYIDPRCIPHTEEKAEMEHQSMEQPKKFLKDISNAEYEYPIDEYYTKQDFYNMFLCWIVENGEKSGIYSVSKFEACIKPHIEKKRIRLGNGENPVNRYDTKTIKI